MDKNKIHYGFDDWYNTVRQFMKMQTNIILSLFVLQVAATGILSYIFYGKLWGYLTGYLWQCLINFVMPDMLSTKKAIGILFDKSFMFFIISTGVWFIYPAFHKYFKNRTKSLMEDKYISGAKLITESELNKEILKDKEATNLQIGNIKIPISAEVKHALIIGRPGAGKTTALSQIIDKLREKNSKGIIYDFKGDYLSKFYSPERGDLIFNPLDSRSLNWNIFNEINTRMDVEAIAGSLIPESQQQDPFWHDAARGVFADILFYLHRENRQTNKDIWNMVSADTKVIADAIKTVEGAGYSYIQDSSGKQALSVIATLMQFTSFFKYMNDDIEDMFSITDWLNNTNKKGFIFITNYADIQDTLKPILSLYIDLLGRKLLSMKDDFNRRIYFLIDEFGTLQKLTTIVKLLTLSRSKGGSTWLGIQDTGQIDRIYSNHIRQAIVNACGTSAMFGVSDPDTSEFLSKKIGDTHYSRVNETKSGGVEDNKDGYSITRIEDTKKLIKGSDLTNLKDLECFIKLPNYYLCKTKLQHKPYEDRADAFKLRDGLSMDKIVITQKVVASKTTGLWDEIKREVKEKEQGEDRERE